MVFTLTKDIIFQLKPEKQDKNQCSENVLSNLADFEMKVSNASDFETKLLQRVIF